MVLERGGVSMQGRIRYYITKSGEEPTVRSVKVAKSSSQRDDLDVSIPVEAVEAKSPRDANVSPGEDRVAPGKSRSPRVSKRGSGDAQK